MDKLEELLLSQYNGQKPTKRDPLEQILVDVDYYQRMELERPAWLQKQVDGLYQGDERGLAMIADGLLDQRDALDKAKYIPYKPGAKK